MAEDQAVKQIASDLLTAGVRPAGVLHVHSSLSSLGPVPGGAETVIGSLLEAIGPEGTLLLPALSYKYVSEANPVFDLRATPTNVGAIPEHFRTRAGTIRSVHPTHSICGIGKLTAELLEDHHLGTTPVGPHSPLSKLPQCGGQILMLGCGLLPNTSMHGIEELVEPPYLFGDATTFRLIHAGGSESQMHCRGHDFDGWRQKYGRLESLLLAVGGITSGKVLAATVYVIDAAAMWRCALAAMKEDPLFFVDHVT